MLSAFETLDGLSIRSPMLPPPAGQASGADRRAKVLYAYGWQYTIPDELDQCFRKILAA
jgi:hypothetical protein